MPPAVHRQRASAPPIPRVLWVGPRSGAEFEEPFRRVASAGGCEHVEDIAPAVERLTDGGPVDLVLLACRRPLATTREAERLFAVAGDHTRAQLLGVWCEGEGRTGLVLDGVERVFWHAFPAWWESRLVDEVEPAALMPDETVGPIVVESGDRELAGALTEALGSLGRQAVWAPALSGDAARLVSRSAAAVVWDGVQLGGAEADRLSRLGSVARRTGTPVIAMLDFPRPETVAAARELGAAWVVGKPIDVDQLSHVIERATAVGESLSRKRADSWRERVALVA